MQRLSLDEDEQIAFVRRLLHFGIVPESLPVAAETTLGLERAEAIALVTRSLREEDVEVVFPGG